MRLTSSRAYTRPTPVPKMPTGLVELMEGLTREVLRNNPENVYEFCANHMEKLLEIRDGPSLQKPLSLEEKIAKAQEIMRQKAKERREKFDKQILSQKCKDENDRTTVQEKIETNSIQENMGIPSLKAPVHHELEHTSEVEISHDANNSTNTAEDTFQSNPTEQFVQDIKPVTDTFFLFDEGKIENNSDADKNEIELISVGSLNKLETTESVNKEEFEKLQLQSIAENSELQLYTNSESIKKKSLLDNLQTNNSQLAEVAQILCLSHNIAKDKKVAENKVDLDPTKDTELQNKSENDKEVEIDSINTNPSVTEIINEETFTSVDMDNMASESVNTETVSNDKSLEILMDNDNHETDNELKETPEIINSTVSHTSAEKELNEAVNIQNKFQKNISNVDSIPANILDNSTIIDNKEVHNMDPVIEIVVNEGMSSTQFNDDSEMDTSNENKTPAFENVTAEPSANCASHTKQDSEEKAEKENVSVTHLYEDNLSTTVNDTRSDQVEIEPDHEIIEITESSEPLPLNIEIPNTNSEVHKSDSKESTSNDIFIEDSSVKNIVKTNDNNDSNGTNSNVDLETAAITIQKVFRSFMFKSRNSTFDDTANDERNSLDEDSEKKEEYYAAANLSKERRPLGITRMDTVLQTVNEEKSLSLSTDDSSTLSSAATTIQAHVRGFLVRNRLNSNKTVSMNSLVNSHEVLESEVDQQKNKTILNIHIVPEEGNYLSRDESLITSMELSLDSSPPSSINLHPLSYDISERRKMLKREDAIQSISPPSNNSGKLSEESVKEVLINDNDVLFDGEQMDSTINGMDDHFKNLDKEVGDVTLSSDSTITPTTIINISKSEEPPSSPKDYTDTVLQRRGRSFTKMSSDEADVITPYVPSPRCLENSSKLVHSGEFHDVVLPTKISRNDTSVVRGE